MYFGKCFLIKAVNVNEKIRKAINKIYSAKAPYGKETFNKSRILISIQTNISKKFGDLFYKFDRV